MDNFSYCFLCISCFAALSNMVTQAEKKVGGADLIIFSYDRPLQLYALLESVQTYMSHVASIRVIYRTSDDRYTAAYDEIKNTFCTVMMYEQKTVEEFKPLVLQALKEGKAAYVLFAVDDMIVKDYVDLAACVQYLEMTRCYGFYLRLGMHLSFCYTMNQQQLVPPCKAIDTGVFLWTFDDGTCDWNYPNTVDMTVYRKKEVVATLSVLSFYNPNSLEQQWMAFYLTHKPVRAQGLFFAQSKVVNIPLNKVQEEWDNRCMEGYSPEDLLQLFQTGIKIDIRALYQISNNGAHMEYTPTYVPRTY
jgi:hypothetical protein